MVRGVVLPNGLRLETDIDDDALWQQLVDHYSVGRSALFTCPWCGDVIDNVCDERDTETFSDTYACHNDCDLLITHVTPAEHTEYWQTNLDQWKVVLETTIPGPWRPPDEEDEEDLDELLDDEPEFIERDGLLFCFACGELAQPGNEEFDWCDHRTGRGCAYFEASVFNEDRGDDEEEEWNRNDR